MTDVTVSNIGKHHFYHTIAALVEQGFSVNFITRYFTNKKSPLFPLLKKFIPNENLESRYDERISESNIRSLWLLEMLERLNIKLWDCSMTAQYTRFDLLASLFIGESRIFHAPSFYSFRSITKAKKNGAIILLDHSTLHIREWRRNLNIIKKKYRTDIEAINLIESLCENVLAEIELADLILCPSKKVISSCLDEGVPKKKLIYLPLGVDIHKFVASPKKDNIFRVIFVGNIAFHKGVQHLLEAFRDAKLENSELVLVGAIEPYFLNYMRIFNNLNTKHIPYSSHNLLPKLLADSSVFVLPSYGESFGLSIAEAMACGLPVIVTQNASELVENAKNGFIVPVGSSERICEALKILHGDESLCKKMGRYSQDKIKNYSWEIYKKNYIKIINKLVGTDKNEINAFDIN